MEKFQVTANTQSDNSAKVYSLVPDVESKVRPYLAEEHSSSERRFVTTEEYNALLRGLERGQGGFTEAEAITLENWANRVRCETAFIDLTIEGCVNVKFDSEGQLVFGLNTLQAEAVATQSS